MKKLYKAIISGMRSVRFGDFVGVSSTAYKVQVECFNSVKKHVDEVLHNEII